MSEAPSPPNAPGPAGGEPRARKGFRFRHRLQVRFRDCDPMGHANNAVYFTYLEQGRFGYWRDVIGIPHTDERSFILARAECDYRSAALPGEWLDVWVRAASIGRSSFTFEYEIVSGADGRLVAGARSVQVMFDYTANRPLPVPDKIAAALERFEGRALSGEGRRGMGDGGS